MSLLNITSMCFVLTSVAIGQPQQRDENTVKDQYNKVLLFDMGFLRPPVARVQEMYEKRLDFMETTIDCVYIQLQCSFATFAQRYMLLIDGLLDVPDYLTRGGNFKKVLFDDRAAAMLAATINVPGLKSYGNTAWAFWLFADRLHRFLDSTLVSGKPETEHLVAIITAHQSVYAELERFLNANQCASYHFQDKLADFNRQIIRLTVKYPSGNTDIPPARLVAFVVQVSAVFDRQKSANVRLGVPTDGERQITMNALNLNGLLGVQTIIVQSYDTVFWETVVKNRISHEHDAAMDLSVSLGKQAKSTVCFQNEFIDLLRHIALQLGKHLLKATVNGVVDKTGDDTLRSRLSRGRRELSKLEQLVANVTGKPKQATVVDSIIGCMLTCEICSKFAAATERVADLEKRMPSSVLSKYVGAFALSDLLIKNHDRYAVGSDEQDDSIVEHISWFVEKTEQVWSDLNLAVVNSFIAYTSSEVCQQVDASEMA